MTVRFEVVRVKNLHPRMDRNVLVGWLKGAGEHVRRHEPLYLIETRKSTFEICSDVDGVVDLLLVPHGARVSVDEEIALLQVTTEDAAPEEVGR